MNEVRKFLESIKNLKGEDYKLRAMCYMKIFLPEEERTDGNVLGILYNITGRNEFAIV